MAPIWCLPCAFSKNIGFPMRPHPSAEHWNNPKFRHPKNWPMFLESLNKTNEPKQIKKTFQDGLLCKSSICRPAWVKMRRIQNRTALSLNNFLKLEKVLFGEKKNFNQKNSISGYCRFEIAGFTNKISNFTKKGVF